jgi:hypothetical protein
VDGEGEEMDDVDLGYAVIIIVFLVGFLLGGLVGVISIDAVTTKDISRYGKILVDDQVYICEPQRGDN